MQGHRVDPSARAVGTADTVQCAPCATLAINKRYDQVHNSGSNEHFDKVVIKLLEHQLPEWRACAICGASVTNLQHHSLLLELHTVIRITQQYEASGAPGSTG